MLPFTPNIKTENLVRVVIRRILCVWLEEYFQFQFQSENLIAINCRFRFFLRNIEYQSGSVELWNCHTAVLSQFFLFYLFTVERHGLTGSAVSIYIVFLLNCKYSLNKLVFLILLLTNDREINRQRRISPLKKLEILYISRNPIVRGDRVQAARQGKEN